VTELGAGEHVRVEHPFPGIGNRRSGGAAAKQLSECGLVAHCLGEEEPPPVSPGQIARAEPEVPLAERRVQHDAPPGSQHHCGPSEQLVERAR
jgi:hypothetical protein